MIDKPTNKRPLLIDVAALAGVSTATVSRVLHEQVSISDTTRQRVTQAISQLGYISQRPRRKKETSWLAILTEWIGEPFFLEIIEGILEQATLENYLPLVIQMTNRRSQQVQIFKELQDLPFLGMIGAGIIQPADEWIKLYQKIQVPAVVINTKIEHPKITSILVNFEQAAYNATQHLLSLNHKRIAFIGATNYTDYSTAEFTGIQRALQERGLSYPKEYQITCPITPEGASQGISHLMRLPKEKRPTAIFAFDDQMAIYVINAIRQYQLRIPEDLSIIGFDNIPMAKHTNPPLTTVDIPKRRIGQIAVQFIQRLIGNQLELFGYTFIEGSLIVRESTGPAPVS